MICVVSSEDKLEIDKVYSNIRVTDATGEYHNMSVRVVKEVTIADHQRFIRSLGGEPFPNDVWPYYYEVLTD